MSPLPSWNAWWPLLGVLATEVALIVGVAALLQRCTTSALWRRTIWQSSVLGLILLVALEFTGAARGLADLAQKRIRAGRAAPVQSHQKPGPSSQGTQNGLHADRSQALVPVSPPSDGSRAVTLTPASPSPGPTPIATSKPRHTPGMTAGSRWVAWMILLWLTGTILILLHYSLARLAFAFCQGRAGPVQDARLRERVSVLAMRLRLRRPVRLLESRRFPAPIAFGLLRPTIGLPPQFVARHPFAQQDVMVAHELAHLASGDPVWYLLAEIAVALLWWHPLAWWARRQLHAASENAADDASLLIEDGPKILAECLVELGNRLVPARLANWMGIQGRGFRSGLGRRVQRLVQLRGDSWSPPGRINSGLVKTLGPAALIAGVIFCTAWTVPQSSSKGATMKWQNWKQALGAVTLTAALVNGDNPSTPAAEPAQLAEKSTPDLAVASPAKGDEFHWQAWSPAAVAKARSERRPILVSFTADGCVTCEVNHRGCVDVPAVRQRLKTIQAATLLGDCTRPNELMANELKKFGRTSVPLVLVYPWEPSMTPLVLPSVLTPRIVLDALQYAITPEEQFITSALKPLVEASPYGEQRTAFGAARAEEFGSSDRGRFLEKKLEEIKLEEVMYDGLPLGEVVRQLITESAKRDPAKRGVNFLFGQPLDPPPAAIDPATGLPGPRAEPIDVSSVTIRIMPPLRNVRLIDVLNAITRVADTPLRFSIEDYAVVFSAGSPLSVAGTTAGPVLADAAPLMVKTFTVNTNTFLAGVEKAFGVKLRSGFSDRLDLRQFLAQLGINMSTPHKAVFYNELTGILMVRATPDDLLIVDAAIATLGGTPEGQSQTSSVTTPRAAAAAEEAVVKLIQALSKAIPEVGK